VETSYPCVASERAVGECADGWDNRWAGIGLTLTSNTAACGVWRFVALAAAVCLYVFPAGAQDETPIFRSETTLVEFTVIALDKNGDPATDLEKKDFVVRDKGRRRDLALFRFEGGEQPRTVPQTQPGIFTNTPDLTPGPPRNITAVVLDTLNTQMREQIWVKAQAMRHLSALLPDTRVAVYLLGRELTVLHDFTDDAKSLRDLIGETKLQLPAPSLGQIDDMAREMETLIQRLQDAGMRQDMIVRFLQAERTAHELADEQRAQKTLASLEALGDHLAGIPGRKSILWIGSGFPMLSVTGALERDTAMGQRSREDLVRNAARRLAQQGITMYMFDARGMQTQADLSMERRRADPSSLGRRSPYERLKENARISADPTPTMAKFADITGGRFYWNTNNMGRAVNQITSDSEGTYSLGFYADGDPDDRWHNLDVRVKRKGVRLMYRDGYLSAAAPETPIDWTEERWSTAVFNPVGSTAVRLDARLQFSGGAEGRSISMVMLIEAEDLHFREVDGQSAAAVEVAIVDRLPNGQYEIQRNRVEIPFPKQERGELGLVPVRHSWELTADATVVRLMVLDRLTGRHGTLDVPVKDIPRAQSDTGQGPDRQ